MYNYVVVLYNTFCTAESVIQLILPITVIHHVMPTPLPLSFKSVMPQECRGEIWHQERLITVYHMVKSHDRR